MKTTERVGTLIIGAGQAGLSAGYHLWKRRLPFLIVDANARIGDQWRRRWDSLRLFTPARYCGLDGWPFPAPPFSFPTKDEMADYLERYAEHFDLPVRTGVRIERLTRQGDGFVAHAREARFEADTVIVAMSAYQSARIPELARALDPSIVQLHSIDYRAPSQLAPGDVLVVGAGNSGGEIAMEAARTGHRVWLSGRKTGEVPFDIDGRAARLGLTTLLLRVIFHRLLTLDTPLGRKASHAARGTPLIRLKERTLRAAGIERVARTAGVRDGRPVLEDGRVLDVSTVVWCTGFDPALSWIDLPVFGEDGAPMHERGIATTEPGLFFVGRHFQYAMSSAMIHGVGRDAESIAQAVAVRARASVRAVRGRELVAAVRTTAA